MGSGKNSTSSSLVVKRRQSSKVLDVVAAPMSENRKSSKRASKRASKSRDKSIKADTLSHLMHIATRDWSKGKLDAAPVMVIGWLMFKNPVSPEQVKQEIKEKLLNITRYRAVPRERDGWSYWEKIPIEDMDLDYHVQECHRDFKTQEEFNGYIQEILSQGLDLSKPWWRYILVDSLPCGRFGLISITDHGMGDGASQVSALLSLCEDAGENPVFSPKGIKRTESSRKKLKVRKITALERASAFAEGVYTPILEQIMPNDMPTKLKQPSGVFPKKWNFACSTPEDLLDVNLFKDIKERIPGATVNDAMLACTALAMKRYYEQIGDPIMKTDKDIRATFAFNARPPSASYTSDKWFGNHIVIGVTTYPLHKSRVDTLLQFRDQVRVMKMSPDLWVRKFLAETVAKLPRDKVIDMSVESNLKFSIMISNVLLSLKRLRIFGQDIDGSSFLTFSPLGMYAGVNTYMDKVGVNFVTTEDTGADPNEILPYFISEAKALHEEVMAIDPKWFIKQDKPAPLKPGVVVFYSIVLGIPLIITLLLLQGIVNAITMY